MSHTHCILMLTTFLLLTCTFTSLLIVIIIIFHYLQLKRQITNSNSSSTKVFIKKKLDAFYCKQSTYYTAVVILGKERGCTSRYNIIYAYMVMSTHFDNNTAESGYFISLKKILLFLLKPNGVSYKHL